MVMVCIGLRIRIQMTYHLKNTYCTSHLLIIEMSGGLRVAISPLYLEGVWYQLIKSFMAWNLQYVMHHLLRLEYVIATVYSV